MGHAFYAQGTPEGAVLGDRNTTDVLQNILQTWELTFFWCMCVFPENVSFYMNIKDAMSDFWSQTLKNILF